MSTCAILLPSKYAIKEGEPLWGGVRLGRLLGAGVQVSTRFQPVQVHMYTPPLAATAAAPGSRRPCPCSCPTLRLSALLSEDLGKKKSPEREERQSRLPSFSAFLQARVFELDYDDGRPTGKVIKVSHTGASHADESGRLGAGLTGLTRRVVGGPRPPLDPHAPPRLPPLPACLPGPCCADLGHRMLNNPVIWIGMEREWEIGTQVCVCG